MRKALDTAERRLESIISGKWSGLFSRSISHVDHRPNRNNDR